MFKLVSRKVVNAYHFFSHHLPALFFIGGFVWDAATLGRSVSKADLFIFAVYLLAASLIIFVISRPHFILADTARLHPRLQWLYTSQWPYLSLQFLFGSMLSALFILYFKSASYAWAWVMTLMLGFLLVANEFLEQEYRRFTLSWTLLGLCAMLLLNFALPYLFGSIHAVWFYLSTVLGAALVVFLYRLTPQHLGSIWPVWLVAILLMLAYRLDMIPPVPLVKREVAMAYQIHKQGAHYQLTQQASAWWVFWRKDSDDLIVAPGQKAYCFSSVFAPAGLHTKLYHDWQLKTKQGWVTQSRASFSLNGGRQDGYRGYTYKSNPTAGAWRVRVENETNKTIAIHYFSVNATSSDKETHLAIY